MSESPTDPLDPEERRRGNSVSVDASSLGFRSLMSIVQETELCVLLLGFLLVARVCST